MEYDVIVIGGGHAGCEAALAAARLGAPGKRTLLLTMALDAVANMPCNPAIGGSAKGHLVCEIDALGGEMGRAADACTLQSRLLGRSKGVAVQSLRAQVDRRAYHVHMKRTLEAQPGLDVRQADVCACAASIVSRGTIKEGWTLETRAGETFSARAVVVATGTYLAGLCHVGEHRYAGGPDGLREATGLGEALRRLGLPLRRFKTGTPPRVHADSVDVTRMERQPGDEPVLPFHYASAGDALPVNSHDCWLTWTTAATRQVVLENLHRSAMYGGHIEGVGPRYCPSIEDKIVRFADKERHQVFVEPTGADTRELYLQGLSSSLPVAVQEALVHTIPGLEEAIFTRPAYAIEYDCLDPLALSDALGVKGHPGLFGAGQFNGTSGYEEAAAQGLLAGVNAMRFAQGESPVTLGRGDGYLGVMVDDLTTRGCSDPYRVLTSRAEYRLLLRQDNAAHRLTPIGRAWGLVGDAQWAHFQTEEAAYNALTRGEIPNPPHPRAEARFSADILYAGYIKRQESQLREAARLEQMALPEYLNYASIHGLRLEAREKLARVAPRTLGQAARVEGVTPADVWVLMVYVKSLQEDATC